MSKEGTVPLQSNQNSGSEYKSPIETALQFRKARSLHFTPVEVCTATVLGFPSMSLSPAVECQSQFSNLQLGVLLISHVEF